MSEQQRPPKAYTYYEYNPNLAGNSIFIVLFALLCIGHTFLQFRKRTWYWIPFSLAIGCKSIFFWQFLYPIPLLQTMSLLLSIPPPTPFHVSLQYPRPRAANPATP